VFTARLCPVHAQGNETLILMLDRWRKLHKDLYNAKTDSFDLSKVPDVHDNIRCVANASLMQWWTPRTVYVHPLEVVGVR
jgi:hypothetical protein